MARTIVYERRIPIEVLDDSDRRAYGAFRAAAGQDDVAIREGDGFAERLLKYIPGEALALIALITAGSSMSDGQVIALVAVGAIGQILWLQQRGAQLDGPDRPSARFFVFALVAYLAWVLGTCPTVRELVDVDQTTAAIVMASVAYLLPLVDPIAHERLDGSEEPVVLER